MTARIAPAQPPYSSEIQALLDSVMRGKPPLLLFATVARDPRLLTKFLAGALLDRGNLTLKQREIVIARTTALCKSEYEWGVHMASFASHVGFTDEQIVSLSRGGAADSCWTSEEKLLLLMCDQLDSNCTLDDAIWQPLKAIFSDEAMLELLMLTGSYRKVSYLTNALQLPLEPNAARFTP